MRRKILMGVLALALPAGTLAGLSSAAVAGGAQNPITCTGVGGGGGVVTFGTPLSTPGVATSSKTAVNTTISGSSFTCNGMASHTGTLTLTGGKNAKLAKTDPRYNKTAGIKYVTGQWAEFAKAGGSLKKSLKQIVFTVGGQSVTFKSKSASLVLFGVCGSDVGFTITGQVKGTYADNTATVTSCLLGDSGGTSTGNFGSDYQHAEGVVTATIDPTTSKATI